MGGESQGDRRLARSSSCSRACRRRRSRRPSRRALQDRRLMDWLEALNERLQPYDLHFAIPRAERDWPVVGYAMASRLVDGFREHTQDTLVGAFDAAVLMKSCPVPRPSCEGLRRRCGARLAFHRCTHEATEPRRKCLEAGIPGVDSLLKELGGAEQIPPAAGGPKDRADAVGSHHSGLHQLRLTGVGPTTRIQLRCTVAM